MNAHCQTPVLNRPYTRQDLETTAALMDELTWRACRQSITTRALLDWHAFVCVDDCAVYRLVADWALRFEAPQPEGCFPSAIEDFVSTTLNTLPAA